MEQTTRLDLYKLANGDYANHWETPMNANAQAIDDEFAGLATELVGSTTGAFTGLKGTEASLVARLNNAMEDTGDIKYNSGDLDKSCHQMDGFETTEINDRLGNIDRREFVNARLRYLQRSVASGEYLHKLDAYDPTSALPALDQNRYVDNFSQRYGSQLFCFSTDCNDPTHAGGGVLEINPMGWCSIGGRLFYHKNISYNTLVADGQWQIILTEEPYVAAGVVNIDNRLIRSHVATGNTGGTTVGGSLFASVGIGAVSSVIANNDWQPEVFQVLRIEVSVGVFEEYLIKAVNADSVEIYGEFPYNPGLVGCNWWVLDYTIPCVNFKPFVFGTVADLQALMTGLYYSDNRFLTSHMLTYTHATGDTYASRLHGPSSLIYMNPKQLFVNMSTEALAVGEYFETAIDAAGALNITPYNVKSMSVLCMDKWSDDMSYTVFSFSINPKLLENVTKRCIPVVHPEIVRDITMNGIPQIRDTWFDAPLPTGGALTEVRTYLRVHCDTTMETAAWTNTPPAGASVFKGRQWWGVLIEFN